MRDRIQRSVGRREHEVTERYDAQEMLVRVEDIDIVNSFGFARFRRAP